MIDITKLSNSYDVRIMHDSQADEILALCLQNTQYYQYCGKQPSRELVISDLHITPPGISSTAKYYVGFYDAEDLVAIMDLVEGYPTDDSAFIGFFMMNKDFSGKQIGSGIIQEVCMYLKEMGMTEVRLGIDKGNPQSTHFWKKNGFTVIKEVKQSEGTILVAWKPL